MYVSSHALVKAIGILKTQVHPFVGITFIACKKHNLKVGSTDQISIDGLSERLLSDRHRIDPRSSFYFQPFKGGPNWWVGHRYSSTGLQTINTQTFSSVFIHPRNSKQWGFAQNYVEAIQATLKDLGLPPHVPADALAIWLFKDENLKITKSYEDIVEYFFDRFNITKQEQIDIFSARLMNDELPSEEAFSSEPLEMNSVVREFPASPDAEAESGRTIASMFLIDAGPAPRMEINFGERLTIITGDNGLGKSFLLDFAWWIATGRWADRQALPRLDKKMTKPRVNYALTTRLESQKILSAHFDQKSYSWVRSNGAITVEALAIFSKANGSFALSDPYRSQFGHGLSDIAKLTSNEVWDGRNHLIEGLIRDWVKWQTSANQKTFDQFSSVLRRLSPEDLGILEPGDPVRIPGDSRDIPTIRHRYGTVPVTHASSGVQRVLLLSYLMIWSWQEHELAASHLNQPPLRRMMVIVDELEAHLHPKWQRIVMPALMGVGDLLSSDLAIQMISATHSPMILASMETDFTNKSDALYHLYGAGDTVKLEEIPFIKYGDVSGWLTSPLFGLRHARSKEAEAAIEAAKVLQSQENPSSAEVKAISEKLKLHLANDDKFWPRWLYFAEQNGVIL